ncbi:MAG: glucosyltransferase domain-containing protein, partial [Eubacterium sp.]
GEPVAFLWDYMAVTVWFLAGIVFMSLLTEKMRKEILPFLQFVFLVYFTTLPFVPGQIMAFSMSSFPVATGILASAFSLRKTLLFVETKDKKTWIAAVLLLLYGVSIYQAILGMYITAVVILCLIGVLEKNRWSGALIANSAIIAGMACLVFGVLTKLCIFVFQSDSQSYLSENFIGWIEDPGILHALFMAFANVGRVSFNVTIGDVNIYGGAVICVGTIGFILCMLYLLFMEREKGKRLKLLLFSGALLLAPFAIYLLLGTYKTQGRMLLGLSLSGAFEYLLILRCLWKKKILHHLAVLTVVYLLFFNLGNTNRIYYYDYLRYTHDKVIANEIMYDIRKQGLDYHQKALVFIGKIEPEVGLNVKHDSLGFRGSYFKWDDGNIGRINKFLVTEGYQVAAPSSEQIQRSILYSEQMQAWPLKGSIIETNDTIIIKLSDPTDKWYRINGVANVDLNT